jgi:CheY-like chemotaxis protein
MPLSSRPQHVYIGPGWLVGCYPAARGPGATAEKRRSEQMELDLSHGAFCPVAMFARPQERWIEVGTRMIAPANNPASTALGLRILVVEDELMISMLVEDMLAELGHKVAGIAASVEEATRLANQGDFDGALLDVNLNGKTIDAVAETLMRRDIPFVFTTGYGQQGIPDAYRDWPALQKPYQTQQLGQALARAVARRSRGAGH